MIDYLLPLLIAAMAVTIAALIRAEMRHYQATVTALNEARRRRRDLEQRVGLARESDQ